MSNAKQMCAILKIFLNTMQYYRILKKVSRNGCVYDIMAVSWFINPLCSEITLW